MANKRRKSLINASLIRNELIIHIFNEVVVFYESFCFIPFYSFSVSRANYKSNTKII